MAERHRLRRKSLIITVVAAVILVAGGVGAWAVTRSSSSTAAAAPTTRDVAASVQTLKQTVSTTGTIEPATQSDLTFASAGTVTAVKVAVGDKVTAGEALATIDPTDLDDALALAQAQLDSATTALTSAQSGGTATSIAAAQAQVDAATAKRNQAQSDVAGASLTSPIAGTVAAVGYTVGQSSSSSGAAAGGAGAAAAGSGGTTSSTSAAGITVISTSSWIVDASVGSADLASMKKGLQATITPSGATQPIFGTVSSVGIVATSTTGGAATFPVTVAVTGSPGGLYAGGSATVVVTTRQIADALTVPTAAVHSTGGQTTVQLVKNGATTTTPVTIGLVSGQVTQVTKGLSEGDEVAVETRGFGGLGGTGGTGGSGTTRQGTTRSGTGYGGTGYGGGTGQGGVPAGGAPGGS